MRSRQNRVKRMEFIVRSSRCGSSLHHRVEKIAALEGLKALVIDDDFNTCDSDKDACKGWNAFRNGHFL